MRAIDLYAECISGEWKGDAKTDTQWALRRSCSSTDGVSYILAFPPTQSDQDWRQNFRFWKSALPWKNKQADPYKDMPHPWQAHAGFTEKYKAVRDEIMAELKTARPAQLYVTGYSQGGALATIAYEDIVFNIARINPRMYLHGAVFGSPRVVGWKAPAARWDGLVRYECSGDPVPWVPPFLFGYRHVGECYQLGSRCFPNPMRHAAYGVELSGAVGDW